MKKLLYLSIFVLFSCQSSNTDNTITEDDKEAIKQQTRTLLEAYAEKDFDKLSAVYTEDVFVMPPNMNANEGLEEHRNWIREMPGNLDGEITPVEIGGTQDLAYARGTYDISINAEGETVFIDKGKYLELWRKDEAGNWKIFRDIWNPSIQQANKELIMKANEEIITNNNLDYIEEAFADDYVLFGEEVGPQGIRDYVSALSSAFSDLEISVEILAAEGNVVTWRRTHTGTHEGEFMGIPGTNKEVTWEIMIYSRIVDGKIQGEFGYGNTLEQFTAE